MHRRDETSRRPTPASPTALALAAAVMVGVGALPGGLAPAGTDRRAAADPEAAVASLIACLNDAAKTLAGAAAVTAPMPVDSPPVLPAVSSPAIAVGPAAAPPCLRPSLGLRDLPPPARS
ncbi:MAG: hypothetical protein AAF710_04690 [Planctomycetota bacterium]